jgi:hypothetical protein
MRAFTGTWCMDNEYPPPFFIQTLKNGKFSERRQEYQTTSTKNILISSFGIK